MGVNSTFYHVQDGAYMEVAVVVEAKNSEQQYIYSFLPQKDETQENKDPPGYPTRSQLLQVEIRIS